MSAKFGKARGLRTNLGKRSDVAVVIVDIAQVYQSVSPTLVFEGWRVGGGFAALVIDVAEPRRLAHSAEELGHEFLAPGDIGRSCFRERCRERAREREATFQALDLDLARPSRFDPERLQPNRRTLPDFGDGLANPEAAEQAAAEILEFLKAVRLRRLGLVYRPQRLAAALGLLPAHRIGRAAAP